MLSYFYKGVLLLRMEASDCCDSRPRGIHSRMHVSYELSLTSLLLWGTRCVPGMEHDGINLHSAHDWYHGSGGVTIPG